MDTIITIQGDTWDTIARRAYGDEKAAQALMEARENTAYWTIRYSPAASTWPLRPCQRKRSRTAASRNGGDEPWNRAKQP